MNSKKELWHDLGLSYEDACHAMQTGVAYEMEMTPRAASSEPKHLRVGINSAHVSDAALAHLLIERGVFTRDEYLEAIRLLMNHEVYLYQQQNPGFTFR